MINSFIGNNPYLQGAGMSMGGMRNSPALQMMQLCMQMMQLLMAQFEGQGGGGFSPMQNPSFGGGLQGCAGGFPTGGFLGQGGGFPGNFAGGMGFPGSSGGGAFPSTGGRCGNYGGSSPVRGGGEGSVPTPHHGAPCGAPSMSLGGHSGDFGNVSEAVAAQTRGGRASMKEGVMTLKDPKTGEVLGNFEFTNGGGGRGAIPYGTYEISNGRRRSDIGSMMRGGFGYSFDLTQKGMPAGMARDPRFGKPRELLRVHPDGGNKGTLGCFGIKGGRATQEAFYRAAKELERRGGGKFTIEFQDPATAAQRAAAAKGVTTHAV